MTARALALQLLASTVARNLGASLRDDEDASEALEGIEADATAIAAAAFRVWLRFRRLRELVKP